MCRRMSATRRVSSEARRVLSRPNTAVLRAALVVAWFSALFFFCRRTAALLLPRTSAAGVSLLLSARQPSALCFLPAPPRGGSPAQPLFVEGRKCNGDAGVPLSARRRTERSMPSPARWFVSEKRDFIRRARLQESIKRHLNEYLDRYGHRFFAEALGPNAWRDDSEGDSTSTPSAFSDSDFAEPCAFLSKRLVEADFVDAFSEESQEAESAGLEEQDREQDKEEDLDGAEEEAEEESLVELDGEWHADEEFSENEEESSSSEEPFSWKDVELDGASAVDPNLGEEGAVQVVSVHLRKGLELAEVEVVIDAPSAAVAKVFAVMQKRVGRLRQVLAKSLSLRRCPQVRLSLHDSERDFDLSTTLLSLATEFKGKEKDSEEDAEEGHSNLCDEEESMSGAALLRGLGDPASASDSDFGQEASRLREAGQDEEGVGDFAENRRQRGKKKSRTRRGPFVAKTEKSDSGLSGEEASEN